MNRTACATPEQTGCILSVAKFRRAGQPGLVIDAWVGTEAAERHRPPAPDMVCTNPLSGTAGGAARSRPPISARSSPYGDLDQRHRRAGPGRGALRARACCSSGRPARRSARSCFPAIITTSYDYALFWGAIRADVARRLTAFAEMISAAPHEYRAALPERGGRLLGLDVGTKTIGLATCDPGWSFACAAETLSRSKFTADLADPARLRRDATASSAWSSACRSTWTAATVRGPSRFAPSPATSAALDLPVLLWDERWSTQRGGARDDRRPT